MAPSQRAHAPHQRKQQDLLDTASISKSFQQDTWDTTPLKLPGFWAYIKDRAPKVNIKWRTLVELGYTMSKRDVCVASVQHAIDLQAKSYGPYSFDNPSPLVPGSAVTATAPAAAPAASAPASAAPSAAPPPASSPLVVLGSGPFARYTEHPEAIEELDSEFGT